MKVKRNNILYGGIGAIAVFLVIVISIFAAGIIPFPSSKNITMEEYEKIQTGMTHKEVSEIVGSTGEFISDEYISGSRYTLVRWRKSLSTTGLADVYFINGRVDSKTEFGL